MFECGLAGVIQAPKRNLNMRNAFTDAEWLLIAPDPSLQAARDPARG